RAQEGAQLLLAREDAELAVAGQRQVEAEQPEGVLPAEEDVAEKVAAPPSGTEAERERLRLARREPDRRRVRSFLDEEPGGDADQHVESGEPAFRDELEVEAELVPFQHTIVVDAHRRPQARAL